MIVFGSLRELRDNPPEKCADELWRNGRPAGKAYLYLVLASGRNAKIGATINPVNRIPEIGMLYRNIQQIIIATPRRNWRPTEKRLTQPLEQYTQPGLYCRYGSKEWFKFPNQIAAAARQCFVDDCSQDAIRQFEINIGKPNNISSMKTIIGTCSICGGQVCVPHIWHGVNPPVPQCVQCNAVAANHGPVIPMNPMTIETPRSLIKRDMAETKA